MSKKTLSRTGKQSSFLAFYSNFERLFQAPKNPTFVADTFDENVKPAGCPDDEDTEFFPGDEVREITSSMTVSLTFACYFSWLTL